MDGLAVVEGQAWPQGAVKHQLKLSCMQANQPRTIDTEEVEELFSTQVHVQVSAIMHLLKNRVLLQQLKCLTPLNCMMCD